MSTLRARVLQRLILACWMATSVVVAAREADVVADEGERSKLLKVADDLVDNSKDIK